MDQIGKVVLVEENSVKVELERNEACHKCGICHMGRTQRLLLTVPNTIDAKEGQRVLVRMAGANVVKAGAIVYLIPLAALLAGLAAAYWAAIHFQFSGRPELWGMAVGIALFGLAFFIIRRLEPVWQRKPGYNPQLVRLVEPYEKLEDVCRESHE